MGLRGERVEIRPLTRDDLDEIEAWTPYTDPLYVAWNRFPWHRLGKDLWHELESVDPEVERYAIVDSLRRVIGVAGLVNVDGGNALVLSIFLGADFVGQGLGSDALRTLLRYAFQERGLAAVCLQVAAANVRARRVYERCGFRLMGRRYRPVEEGESLAFLDDARYRELRACFRREAGRIYALFYDMEVRAADWRERERGHGRSPRQA